MSNRRPFGLTCGKISCYLRIWVCIRYTICGFSLQDHTVRILSAARTPGRDGFTVRQ
jgi:hypothetical protein